MSLGDEDVPIRQGTKLCVDFKRLRDTLKKASVIFGKPFSQVSNRQGEILVARVFERAQQHRKPVNHLRIDRADNVANGLWLGTLRCLSLRRGFHRSAISLAVQGPLRDSLGERNQVLLEPSWNPRTSYPDPPGRGVGN